MKLSELQEGTRARVIRIDCDAKLKQRLGALGIFESTLVSIVYQIYFGCIVQVFGSKFMIGDDILDKIIVEKL